MTGLNAFQYPAHAHRRRHGPQGYASAAQFREWLRDEFAFRCVYCLEREQWVNRTGHFHAEHFQPVALRPDLELDYDNLVYACHVCNAVKQDQTVPNPLRVLLDASVKVQPNGTLNALTKEAAKLVEPFGSVDGGANFASFLGQRGLGEILKLSVPDLVPDNPPQSALISQDIDLLRLTAAWALLPPAAKQAILRILESAGNAPPTVAVG